MVKDKSQFKDMICSLIAQLKLFEQKAKLEIKLVFVSNKNNNIIIETRSNTISITRDQGTLK